MKAYIYLEFYEKKPKKSVAVQKQPFRDVLRKRCSENMQQIYKRTLV